jgi:hypothetical protein
MKIFNINISPTVVSTIGLVIVLAIAFSIFFKPLDQGAAVLPRASQTSANSQKQADVDSGVSSDTARPSSSANLHKQIKRTNAQGQTH